MFEEMVLAQDRLASADEAVGALAGVVSSLQTADAGEVAAVMGRLTTLVGRLDGLRVEVARHARERDLYRAMGAPNLAAWLRSDARLADDAWKVSRLAAMAPVLPRISGLLSDGRVSLAQAATAGWQISNLPDCPQQPPTLSDPASPADDGSEDAAGAWAGLWKAGDVQAAADELFARFLPDLDGPRLRHLGAHLREAADASGYAGDERSDFDRRSLRVSRSLNGAGEITGRLHAEAAEQVIAALQELGVRTGPDDTRTKAQRWADTLVYLANLRSAPAWPPGAGPPGPGPPGAGPPGAGPCDDPARCGADPAAGPDDDEPCHGDGHEHAAGNGDPAQPRSGYGRQPAAREPGDGRVPAALPAGLRRPRVIVTVPLSTLLGEPLSPGAVIGTATPVSGEAARRIACDAEVIRLVTTPAGQPGRSPEPSDAYARPAAADSLGATGQLLDRLGEAIAKLPAPLGGPSAALDIGRKSHGWTPRQRDALYVAYGGTCGFPGGCSAPIEVIHHIQHWADGGRTSVENGWPACQFHHWLVHEGGWRLARCRDGSVTSIPPPPGWRPGTVYRSGKPVPEAAGHAPPTRPPRHPAA